MKVSTTITPSTQQGVINPIITNKAEISLNQLRDFVSKKIELSRTPIEQEKVIAACKLAIQYIKDSHNNPNILLAEYSTKTINNGVFLALSIGTMSNHLKNIYTHRDEKMEYFMQPSDNTSGFIPWLNEESIRLNDKVLKSLQIVHNKIQVAAENKLPPRLERLEQIEVIRYGDLHGSFRKLIDHFYRAGVIDISQDDYEQLISNPKLINSFIKEAKLRINTSLPHPELIFAGDIFAERNPDDEAKLDLLLFLNDQGVNFKIIWSNHDATLYQFFGNALELSDPKSSIKKTEGTSQMRRSLMVDTNTTANFTKFISLIKKRYCLIDYRSGVFFSHAPVHGNLFKELCSKYKIDSNLNIEKTVEALNQKFKELVVTDKVHEFFQFVWVRKHEYADEDCNMIHSYADTIQLQYSGHDEYETSVTMVSLDNECLKDPQDAAGNEIISIQYRQLSDNAP